MPQKGILAKIDCKITSFYLKQQILFCIFVMIFKFFYFFNYQSMQKIIVNSKKRLRSSCRKTGSYIKKMPPETGIILTVLGVLCLIASFVFNVSSNTLLYIGLLLIIFGITAYTNGIKHQSE